MKNRTGVLILAVLCLGLGIGLIVTWTQSSNKQRQDAANIVSLSNDLTKVTETLEAHDVVITNLYKERDRNLGAIQDLNAQVCTVSNALSKSTSDLALETAELAKTRKSLEAEVAEVAKRDTEIATLQRQNQDLDKQALDLSTSITNLNLQIAETQRKLADSNADKATLDKELRRLMAEKSELERQFNDLNVVRAQYAKLKEEMYAARRVEWARTGVYAAADEKGASGLMARRAVPQPQQAQSQPQPQPPGSKFTPLYDLNVEVKSGGSVRVIPPLTNAPARP